MKKIIKVLLILSALQTYGQSVEIKPNDEKLMISSYTENPIIIGRRSGFTSGIPTSTTTNSTLLFLSGRGYSDGEFRTNSAASILFRANQNFSSTAGGSHIMFQTTADNTTSATERMRIAHNGNVGIGTTNPSSYLHISGGVSGITPNSSPALFIEDDRNTYLNLAAPDANETGVLFGRPDDSGTSGGIIYRSNKDMHLRTNGNTTRMTIASSGNVGIGTTNPLSKLHISSGVSGALPELFSNVIIENSSHNILNLLTPDSRESGFLVSRATSGNSGGVVYSSTNKLNFVAGGATRMTINSNGQTTINGETIINGAVSIGQNSPTAKLKVEGDVAFAKITRLPNTTQTLHDFDREGASVIGARIGNSPHVTITITGIAGGTDGMLLYIFTNHLTTIILKTINSDSLIENQFITKTRNDTIIDRSGGTTLIYDGDSMRWREISY